MAYDATSFKVNLEKLAQAQKLENMVKFDKLFKTIMNHCQKMLTLEPRDLNKQLENTVNNSLANPSPMLKYYNELI